MLLSKFIPIIFYFKIIFGNYKYFLAALVFASERGLTETVKLLVKQEGIDINAKDTLLFLSIFILNILHFKITYGNSSNYF